MSNPSLISQQKNNPNKQTQPNSFLNNISLQTQSTNSTTLTSSSAPSTPIKPLELSDGKKSSLDVHQSPNHSTSSPTPSSPNSTSLVSLQSTLQPFHILPQTLAAVKVDNSSNINSTTNNTTESTASRHHHYSQFSPDVSLFLPFKPHLSNAFATMVDTDLLYIVTSSSLMIISTLYELTLKESRTGKCYSTVKTPRVYALCVEMVPRQDLLSKPQSVLASSSSTTTPSTNSTIPATTSTGASMALLKDTSNTNPPPTQPQHRRTPSNLSHMDALESKNEKIDQNDKHLNNVDPTRPVLKETPESLYSDPKKPDIPITSQMHYLFIPTVSLRIYSSFPMNQTQWRNPVEVLKFSPPAFIMKPQHITHSQMLSEKTAKANQGAQSTSPPQQQQQQQQQPPILTHEEKHLRHIESLIWCEELQPPQVNNNSAALQNPNITDSVSKPFYAFQLPLTISSPPNNNQIQPQPQPQPQPQQHQQPTIQSSPPFTSAQPIPSFTPSKIHQNHQSGSQSTSITALSGSASPSRAFLSTNDVDQIVPFSLNSTSSATSTNLDNITGHNLASASHAFSSTDTHFNHESVTDLSENDDKLHSTTRSRSSSMTNKTPTALSLDTFFDDESRDKLPEINTPSRDHSTERTPMSINSATNAFTPSTNTHSTPVSASSASSMSTFSASNRSQPVQQSNLSQKPAKTDFFSATWGAFTKSITPTPAKPTVSTTPVAPPANQQGTKIEHRFLCSINPIVSRCWVSTLNWVCDEINDHLAKYNLAARGRKRGESHLPYPSPINFLSFPVPNEPLLNIYSFPPCQSMTSPYHPDRQKEQKDKDLLKEQFDLHITEQPKDFKAQKDKDDKDDEKLDKGEKKAPLLEPSLPLLEPFDDKTSSPTATTNPNSHSTPPQLALHSALPPNSPHTSSAVNTTVSPLQTSNKPPQHLPAIGSLSGNVIPMQNNDSLSSSSQFSAISLNTAQPVLVFNNLGHIGKLNREVDYKHLFQPTLSVVHTANGELVPVYSDLINFERFITEVQNQLRLLQALYTPLSDAVAKEALKVSGVPNSENIVVDTSSTLTQNSLTSVAATPTVPTETPTADPAGDNWFKKIFTAATYTGKPTTTTAPVTTAPGSTDDVKNDEKVEEQDAICDSAQDPTTAVAVPFNILHPKLTTISTTVPVNNYLGLQSIQQIPPFQHHPPVHPMHLMKETMLSLSLKQFYYLCLDNTAPISMNAFHTSLPAQFFQVKTGEWSVCCPSIMINQTNNHVNISIPSSLSIISKQKLRDEPFFLPTGTFQRAIGHIIPPINYCLTSTQPESSFTPTTLEWDPATPEENLTSLLISHGSGSSTITTTPHEIYLMCKDTGYQAIWKQYLFRTMSMKSRVSTPTGMVETRLFKTQRLATFYAVIDGNVEIIGFEMETCSSTPDVKFGDCFVVVDSTLAFSSKVIDPTSSPTALYCDSPSIQLITRSNVKFVQSSWALKAFTGIINSRSRSDNAAIVEQYCDFLLQTIPQIKSLNNGKILTTIDQDMMWPPVVYQANTTTVAKTATAFGVSSVEETAEEIEAEVKQPTQEDILEMTLKLVEVPPQMHPLFVLPVCLIGLPILSFLTGQGFSIPTNLAMCIIIAVVMLQIVSVQKDLISMKKQQNEIVTLLKQQAQPKDSKKGSKK